MAAVCCCCCCFACRHWSWLKGLSSLCSLYEQAAASRILDIPLIVTEQYPKALGTTVSEIDTTHGKVFDKTLFSMCIPGVKEVLATQPERTSVVLFGIEVCCLLFYWLKSALPEDA